MLYIKTVAATILLYLLPLPEWTHIAIYLFATVVGIAVCSLFVSFDNLIVDSKGIFKEMDALGERWQIDSHRISIFIELKLVMFAQMVFFGLTVLSSEDFEKIFMLLTFGVIFCSTRYITYVSDFYIDDIRKIKEDLREK